MERMIVSIILDLTASTSLLLYDMPKIATKCSGVCTIKVFSAVIVAVS